MSDNDSVSERDPDSQFVYQPGDEDILWEVQAITAERGSQYKVKWAGVDPSTGKPWPESWVPKRDCTDDLVVAWKRRRRDKGNGRGRGRGRGRGKRGRPRGSGTGSRTGTSTGSSVRTGSTTTTRRSASKATSSSRPEVEEMEAEAEMVEVEERRRGKGRASGRERDALSSSPPPPPPKPKPKQVTKRKLESVGEERARGRDARSSSPSPPLSKPTSKPTTTATKRKRDTDTPTTTVTVSGAGTERTRDTEGRPRKKQKTIVEVLLPPISSSSDSEGDALLAYGGRVRAAVRGGGTNGEGTAGPEVNSVGSERREETRSRRDAGSEWALEVCMPPSKMEIKRGPRHKRRVIVSDESGDEDRPRQSTSFREGSISKHKSPLAQKDDLPGKDVESAVPPIKVGPPRGVKRQQKPKKFGPPPSKPGSSGSKPPKGDSVVERVSEKGVDNQIRSSGNPMSLQETAVDTRAPPLRHVSIPQASPSTWPRSPILSPGARARLEIFDRMMADEAPRASPAADSFNYDHIHDTFDAVGAFDPPPPPSPPPEKSQMKRPKPSTPNGPVVPETESSGNSQSQSQPSLKPPPPPPQLPPVHEPSPRNPIDLPTIAVIAPSATPSFTSPQDLIPPQKFPPATNHQLKRPTFTIASSTFCSTANTRLRVADPEPPPSSIESFSSPRRINKGKQKAVESDQLQSSLSEAERGDSLQQERSQVTDSALRKRGKELFDQAQLAREAERQKTKKPKRMKAVDEIVSGSFSSPPKASPFPFKNGADGVAELRSEDVVDFSGGANSTTLDSPEHSEGKPLTEEQKERLRFELRQEEEESTQEAMGIHPPPPVKESNEDSHILPPGSPKSHVDDSNRIEQPSTDLILASVIVEASQEQRHADIDIDPSPVNQPASSPPFPVPERLSDTPKRRLGEALSLLNVKSEEIQRLERELSDERNNLQELKAKVAELEQSTEPTSPVRAAWDAERAQWCQERSKWGKDASTWETQRKEMSEENERLTVRLVELSDAVAQAEEVKAKLSELETERLAWTKERDVMLNDMTQRSEELGVLAQVRGEYDQDRLKWEAERTSWAEERARWETERAALQEKQETLSRAVDELTTSAESLKAARASAQKDGDFFREQYLQASAFVSSVRDENVELEKRATIAEGQAQEGVAAIKTLFESRIKALKADVDRWKALTELLQEKDRRTNDELRLRAAQAPELIELCDRLSTENKSLEAEVRRFDQAQQRRVHQRNKLFYQILLLKKERAGMRSKLSKLTKTLEGGTSTQGTSSAAPDLPILDNSDIIDPNDMEMLPNPTPQSLDITLDEPALFPCMWRPEWRDQCQQIFDTKEDLERHVQEHFRDLVAH